MIKLFSYLSFGFLWLFSFLPLRIMYLLSDFTYIIIYYIIGYRKEIVTQNLQNSFPEKSHRDIAAIKKKFYRHFCDLFMETIKLWHMSRGEILKRCSFKNPEILEKYLDQGKSVITILGHYGNWEWMVSYALYTRHTFLPIYKPLHNHIFDKMYIQIRERFGAKTLPKQNTLRTMLKYKKENRSTMTAFIGDQTPNSHNLSYWTQFLNQKTPILMGTEKIAKKLDQPVIYVKMHKLKRGYYEVEFIPLFDKPKETNPFEITEKHTRILESIIREEPQYWLWTHRRWKHKTVKNTSILS